MAINYVKAIEIYCGREIKIGYNPDVILMDNGEGVFISEWNVEGIEQPTIEQLETIWNENILLINKETRIKEVKEKTDKLIEQGFIYNGVDFGSTKIDQNNWNTLLGLKDSVSYPLVNVVKDNDGNYYTIAEKTDLEAIILTGFAMVNSYRASHKVLVDQINGAESQEDLDSIIDNRI